MSTYKNTSGDLTLTGDDGFATLTINYANTVFNGSLTYTGNLTTVDDFIVVAANNTGAVTEMGLLGQTGPTTFAGLRFNSVANAWQISNSVSSSGAPIASYSNIVTTVSAAAAPANVANAVAVYSNVIGGGGTGLYFTSTSANDELVSKGKAIVYGIIF